MHESMKPVSQVMHQENHGFAIAKVNIDNAFLSTYKLSARLRGLMRSLIMAPLIRIRLLLLYIIKS